MKKIILLCCMSICSSMYGMHSSKMVIMPSKNEMQEIFRKHDLIAFYEQQRIDVYADKPCNVDGLRVVMVDKYYRFNRKNSCTVTPKQLEDVFSACGVQPSSE